jgi:hypothetical protein
MARVAVFHPHYDKILWRESHTVVAAMVRQGQADPYSVGVRLRTLGILHPCRTRVARGGPLAAMGMSQEYTTKSENGGRVNGHKRIFIEDKAVFFTATLDCIMQ